MATSDQTPSSALLRLRQADVVRLCGLTAAATGLDLAASHSVVNSQRAGDRLLATVNEIAGGSGGPGASLHAVWAELSDEDGDAARWECNCAHAGPLACAHVAALLSAWIAHPGDFLVAGAGVEPDAGDPLPQPLPDAGRGARPEPVSAPRSLVQNPTSPRRGGVQGEKVSPTTLAAALARMNIADVEVIARRIFGESEDSEDSRMRILTALSHPPRLQALLNRLDASARRLLTLLALGGGATTAADLEALAARRGVPLSALQSDIAVLERHALLLPMLPTHAPSEHGPGASWRHVAGWRIPDEIRRPLSASLPLPLDTLPMQGAGRAAPPLIEPHAAPVRFLRNTPRSLCLALALLAEAPPPLGLPSAAATSDAPDNASSHAKHGNALAPGELAPERLSALARNAGVDASALRLARRLLLQARNQQPGPASVDMARVPVAERPVVLRATFRRWLQSDSAADVLDLAAMGAARIRYDTAHPGFRPSVIAREVSDGRRFVARLLSYAQPDAWYALDDLVTLAWQAHPGFLRGQQSAFTTPIWRLESPREQRALQPHVRDDWMAADGAFIRSLIGGAFALWGAVDLALREDGVAAAFRLTPFGAYLFRRDDEAADDGLVALCDADWGPAVLPLREGALTVQPLAAGAHLLDALALWAAPTAVSGRRLVYTLSMDRACAAFDRNLAPDALPTLLRPLHSRAAEGVATRLSQWHGDWGRTRILTGYTLLEASDEATLVEALAAAPGLAARCRRLSPTLALAPHADAAILRTLLAKRGYAV